MTSRWYVRNIQTAEETQLLEYCTIAGRSLYARISTTSNVTSKEHAKFYVRGDHLFVEDLKSSNGTYINNRKIKPNELKELQVGDRVGLGVCENDLLQKNIVTFCILEVHMVSTPEFFIDNIFNDKEVYEILDSPQIKEEKVNLDIELSENAHCPVQQQSVDTLFGTASDFKENAIMNACIPSISNQSKLNSISLENFSAKIIPDNGDTYLHNGILKPNIPSNSIIKAPEASTSNGLKNMAVGCYQNGKTPRANIIETVTSASATNGFGNMRVYPEIVPLSVEKINSNATVNGTCNGLNGFSHYYCKKETSPKRNVIDTGISKESKNDLQKITYSAAEQMSFNMEVNGGNSNDTVMNFNVMNDHNHSHNDLEPIEIKVEINETYIPSGRGYTIEDDFIIINDDDNDDNNCSQHFNVSLNNNDNQNVLNETMFYSIKKELEEMDKVDGELAPIFIEDDDSETMSNSDVLNFLQSHTKMPSSSDLEKPSTSTSICNNVNKTAVSKMKMKERSEETQSSNKNKCTDDKKSKTATNEKKKNKTIDTKKTSTTNKKVNSCNGVIKNKKYLPPPIIDAPAMPNRKRFAKESISAKPLSADTEITSPQNQKRSIEESSLASTKKIKLMRGPESGKQKAHSSTESTNIHNRKNSVESSHTENACSVAKKVKLNLEALNKRKEKLKQIALKDKKNDNKMLPSCSVKVKKSDGRGNFLLEKVPERTLNKSPPSKSPPTNSNINIDNIILIILKWSVSWLKEQEKKINAPPLVDYDLTKMKLAFSSFKEYQKTLTGLLLLEVWHYIFKESLCSSVTFQAVVSYEDKLSSFVKLKCTSYCSESEIQKSEYVKESDLVLVQLTALINGKTCVHTVFGYINESRRSKVYSNELQMNEVYSINSKYKIEFVVLTKMFKESMEGQTLQFKIITSLTSSLRLFKSINYLEYSPLCKFVIKPNINDFKVPNVSISNLMSGDLLNPTQLRVVMEATYICLRKEPGMYLIQGPPGTGKTTVITNIVQQLLLGHRNKNVRILLAAPSNAAIDELALRLLKRVKPKLSSDQKKKLKLLRVGAKSAVHEELQDYFLDELVKKNMRQDLCASNKEIAIQVRSIEKKIEELKKVKYLHGQENTQDVDAEINKEKANLENLVQGFYPQYNVSYKETENRLLTHATIVCTTLSSCIGKTLHDMFERARISFTCCIIDEVTQSSEPETLIPLMLGISNVVLVGDPQQLPATVFSKDAKDLGFEKSLFARISDNFKLQNGNPIVMLSNQYRMHPEICHFANKEYYKGKLNSSAFVAPAYFGNLKPYLVFNINANYTNQQYQNDIEIDIVLKILTAITKHLSNINTYSIGIVTPYNNQKDAIIGKLKTLSTKQNASIVVNTVDSFQGQEKDIMIMSCVRYTPNTFLSNEQRVNVAITRAKYAFYIVGTHNLFDNCAVFGKLREDAKKRHLLREVKNIHNLDFYDVITQKKMLM